MNVGRKKIPLRDLRTYGDARAIRHPDIDYRGPIDVHVTICADHGTPFHNDVIARMVCENVEFYCRKFGYGLRGYCLMPDHLHVLFELSETEMSTWLREFKSRTTYCNQVLTDERVLWQRSAYDHVCRDGETAETVLAYIIDNPVRRGLVTCWRDWPWTKVFIEI